MCVKMQPCDSHMHFVPEQWPLSRVPNTYILNLWLGTAQHTASRSQKGGRENESLNAAGRGSKIGVCNIFGMFRHSCEGTTNLRSGKGSNA